MPTSMLLSVSLLLISASFTFAIYRSIVFCTLKIKRNKEEDYCMTLIGIILLKCMVILK